LAAWQKSLLIRRDATLRTSGALHLGIFEHPGKIDFSAAHKSTCAIDSLHPGLG
jgi:hypothetical protein